jgi:hypothetical protein
MTVIKYYDVATSTWKTGAVGAASGQVWPTVIGDGVSTSFQVTHGFGTRNVVVTVYRAAPPYDEVEVDVERTTESYVTIRTSPTVPAVGEYIAVVASAGTQATADITMDTWHTVGAAGEPAFGSGFANSGAQPAQFRKSPDGKVLMRGYLSTPAAGGIIFTLPVGYRPPANYVRFNLNGTNAGGSVITAYVFIDSSGVVTLTNTSSPVNVDLSAIEFDTDTVLQTASLIAQPIENWHTVGDAGEPQYLNNWASQDSIRQLPSFRKMPDGTVRLKGTARSTVTQSGQTVIFTLPPGYRPARETWFMCPGSVGGGTSSRIEIGSSGVVNCAGTAVAGQNISMDNISFMAEDAPVGAYASGMIGPSRVLVLPANPVDGQEVYLQTTAMKAAEVPPWLCVYDASITADAYKWRVIGGARWISQLATAAIFTNAAFGDPGSGGSGPDLTLDYAGVYELEVGGITTHNTIQGYVQMGISIAGAAVADTMVQNRHSTVNQNITSRSTPYRKTITVANSLLRMKYAVTSDGGQGTVAPRFLSATPLRIG